MYFQCSVFFKIPRFKTPYVFCLGFKPGREAKKRLSCGGGKYPISLKQDQFIRRSSRQGQMLAFPDKEIKSTNGDNISCLKSFRDKLPSNDDLQQELEGSIYWNFMKIDVSSCFIYCILSPITILRHNCDDPYMTPIK